MAQFNGLKPLSAKLIALAAAIIFAVAGTSWFAGSAILDYSKAIIMITLGVVLFVELGVKLAFPKISNLGKVGLLQWITIGLGTVLLLGGIFALPFIPLELSFITGLTDFAVLIGAVWIAVEALTG